MGVRIRIKRQDNNLITRGQRTEVRIHLKTREIERCKDTKIKREQQMEESISKLYCCLSLHMNFFQCHYNHKTSTWEKSPAQRLS